jgi:hypothetical protein
MHPRSAFEAILLGSSRARKALFGLFLLSLLADLEMLLPKAAFSRWVSLPDLLSYAIGVAVFVGATLLWLLMLYICLHTPERSVGLRLVWALVFVFTLWWGAQLYYLFPFQQILKTREQSE